jgi:hypothetical protein
MNVSAVSEVLICREHKTWFSWHPQRRCYEYPRPAASRLRNPLALLLKSG